MQKKKVTLDQYARVLEEHKEEVYDIAIKAWQMPILHGLITLAADHPGVQKMGRPIKDLIEQVRWWCREKFSEWGFTAEEVEYLDTMREEVQAKEGNSTLTVNSFESGALMGLILKEEEHTKPPLSGVYKQLVEIKKRIEKAEGVTKEFLPGGKLQVTDPAGIIITRDPYPWEVESN